MSTAGTKNISYNNKTSLPSAALLALVWTIFPPSTFFSNVHFHWFPQRLQMNCQLSKRHSRKLAFKERVVQKWNWVIISSLFNWHRWKVAWANDFQSFVGEKQLRDIIWNKGMNWGPFFYFSHAWLKSNHQTERNDFRQHITANWIWKKKIKIKSHYGTFAS